MRFGHRAIGRVLLLVGVLTVGLVLSMSPAEAHGAHMAPDEVVAVDVAADHAAHGHLNHCHGGAFCPAAAVVSLAPVLPEPMLRCGRCVRREPHAADVAATTFDPPPPRVLI